MLYVPDLLVSTGLYVVIADVKSPSTLSPAVAPASLYVTPKSTIIGFSPISFITGETSTT